MALYQKSLDLISIKDINELVANQVRESKNIDYKRCLPEDNDRSKKEFLADVSSFANASGGDLIYGVVENRGVPSRIVGMKIKDVETHLLKYEHMIRDGIDPRIYGVQIRAIEVKKDRYVVIVRVPRSWSSPHMVGYQSYGKFFSRNSYGKHPLDASEIRVAFSLSQQNFDYIRDFRLQRLGALVSGEVPAEMKESSKLVIHITPLSINNPALQVDISQFQNSEFLPSQVFGDSVLHQRFNFDGFLMYSDSAYAQVFRSGAVEIVESNFLSFKKGKAFINPEYEREVVEQIEDMFSFMRHHQIEPPFLIMLSMLDVKGAYMGKVSDFHWYDSQPIDRSGLIVPEVLLEDYGLNLKQMLKPAFYAVWNAAGWPRSMNYNEAGEWVSVT